MVVYVPSDMKLHPLRIDSGVLVSKETCKANSEDKKKS